MSFLKKLASDSVVYGLSSVLGRALNFLLIGLHTTVFLEGEYGLLSLFYTYAAFFNAIYSYGMETAFFRFASDKKLNSKQIYRLILTLLLLSSTLYSALLIVFSAPLTSWMGRPETQNFVIWFALILWLDNLMIIPFALLRFKRKAKKFAFIKSSGILINIALNLFFLLVCPAILNGDYLTDYQGLIRLFFFEEWGMVVYIVIANFVSSLFMFLLLLKEWLDFRFTINWKQIKPILSYSYPILFTSLAAIINEMADRTLLEWLLPDNFYEGKTSIGAIGIYSACYKLSIFITLAIQAFKYAAEPFFFAQHSDKNSPQLFAKVMKYFVLTCLLMFMGVSLNLDILGDLFLKQAVFREGMYVVPVLLIANVFLGIYYNLAVWFKVSKTKTGKFRTHYGLYIAFIGASITLLANFALIPVLGYLGSALATLLSYFAMVLSSYLWGQKYYPIPYNVKAISAYFMLAIALVGSFFFIKFDSFILTKVMQNTSILLYLFVIYSFEKKNFV
jgi:O-antigen/teichoic acid export membrane protein